MHFLWYFKEIQWRGVYVCLGLFFGTFVSYKQIDIIFSILLEPLRVHCNLTTLVSLDITEAFWGQFHVAFLTGLMAVTPLFWVQVWLFLRPSLYKKEVQSFQKILFISFFFIVGAFYFTGIVLVPQVWSFFLGFTSSIESNEGVKNLDYLPCLWPYLNLIVQVFQIVLLTSQIPLVLFFLHSWRWVSTKDFWGMRPWVILITLSWAAIISPPDLLSQLVIFGPVFFFYEIFIFTLLIRGSLQKYCR